MSVVVYHNPKCGTSRNTIQMIRDAGIEPEIVEYLKAGWTEALLKDLFAAAGLTPREALRTRGRPPKSWASRIRRRMTRRSSPPWWNTRSSWSGHLSRRRRASGCAARRRK